MKRKKIQVEEEPQRIIDEDDTELNISIPTSKPPAPKPLPPKQKDEKCEEEAEEEEEAPSTSTSTAQTLSLVLSEKPFSSFGLAPWLVATLEKRMGITKASKIQEVAIPVLLSGRDTFMKAETGTGKTLAYAIPLAQSLGLCSPPITRTDGLRAIIIAPTRELCQQIFGIVKTLLSSFIRIVPGLIVGGQKKKSEKASLRKGINVLVATPGRLTDHLKTTEVLKLAKVSWLVLDEADRLLDLGFERDLSQLVANLDRAAADQAKLRRNVLVSATLNAMLKKLAYFTLRNPVFTNSSGVEESIDAALSSQEYSIPPGLKQHYILLDTKERLPALAGFLRGKAIEGCRVLVFFSCIDAVEFHLSLFSKAKKQYLFTGHKNPEAEPDEPLIPATIFKLHGDLSQIERSSVYEKFKETKSGIIFCTDVAARGIDLPNVDWIIQYDPPGEVSDYVHRVGRTARIGHSGNSLLFLLQTEKNYLSLLQKHQVKLSSLNIDPFIKPFAPSPSTPKQKLLDLSHFVQIHFEHLVLDDPSLAEMARKGFTSYIRAYTKHSRECRKMFNVEQLHLGHVAKSFALREAPSKLKKNMTQTISTKALKARKFLKGAARFALAKRLTRLPALRKAEDTRKPFKYEKKEKKPDGPREPLSLNQGKRRAMNVVLSEFSSGSTMAAPPKKRQKESDD